MIRNNKKKKKERKKWLYSLQLVRVSIRHRLGIYDFTYGQFLNILFIRNMLVYPRSRSDTYTHIFGKLHPILIRFCFNLNSPQRSFYLLTESSNHQSLSIPKDHPYPGLILCSKDGTIHIHFKQWTRGFPSAIRCLCLNCIV